MKGLLGRADFAFDPARDVYVCPAGHDMPTSGHVVPGGLRQCRAKVTSCGPCALKPRYTMGLARMVTRNLHDGEREHVRRLAATPAFRQSARERRKVEMLFAHLKRHLGFRRLRLRGPTGAGNELPCSPHRPDPASARPQPSRAAPGKRSSPSLNRPEVP